GKGGRGGGGCSIRVGGVGGEAVGGSSNGGAAGVGVSGIGGSALGGRPAVGVFAEGGSTDTGQGGAGIFAQGGTGPSPGLAGSFAGDVAVTGNLSKGGGSFKIDHPLDPANKYLYHSVLESPDMKNIYHDV